MNHTEHRAKTPSPTTGLYATARAFIRDRGTGAPSAALWAVFLISALGLLLPSAASATYTRPFLRQLTGTPSRPYTFANTEAECKATGECAAGPFGLAVDAAGNLWLSNQRFVAVGNHRNPQPPFPFDEFDPSGSFLQTLSFENPNTSFTEPESVAINRATGSFYVTGDSFFDESSGVNFAGGYLEIFDSAGHYLKRIGAFSGRPHVAVDNSAEPSSGTVYLAHSNNNLEPPFGNGRPPGIEKFNASGEAKSFSASAEYITGNEITGKPGQPSFQGVGFGNGPAAVSVDSHGNIYLSHKDEVGGKTQYEVDEYEPSGLFLRTFTGTETPGLGEDHGNGGFGGAVEGIAIDTAAGHLLVAVGHIGAAAVDEFDLASGKFLGQITETSPGHPLNGVSELATDSNGVLYLIDTTNFDSEGSQEFFVDAWGAGAFLPTVRLGEATQRTISTALLNGSVNPEALVNPEHSGLSECEFQYVPQSQFEATGFTGLTAAEEAPCVPAAASIPTDEEFHSVHAEATALTSGTTYRYRLLAKTAGTLGAATASKAFAFTAPHAPAVESTFAANISSTFADLHARIDPLGASTSYRFQYAPEADFQGESCEWVCANVLETPELDIGAGGETGALAADVLQHIGGLAPATAYRVRVFASNEVGTTRWP